MSNPRPAIMFFKGDWRRDTAVQSCSYAARGLYLELLIIMDDAPRRGYLSDVQGVPLSAEILARLTGGERTQVNTLLAELEQNGVLSIEQTTNTRYNRRMVRESSVSETRKRAGVASGQARQRTQAEHNANKSTNTTRTKKEQKPLPSSAVAVAIARGREKQRTSLVQSGAAAGDADAGPDFSLSPPGENENGKTGDENKNLPGVAESANTVDLAASWRIWWSTWSAVRGTARQDGARQAWMQAGKEGKLGAVDAAYACTVSYLASLTDPAVGFNPDRFIRCQAAENWAARWPAARLSRSTRNRLSALQRASEIVSGVVN